MQQGGDQDNRNRDQNNNTSQQRREQNTEMSASILQQPSFRRTHEEGKLPSLSSMLPPLPPFNPRSMTSPKDRFGRSPFRNYPEDGGQLPSFMSGERLSPPSQRSPQIGFSNSPPLSAKTRIGSDNYNSVDEASTASSSSLRAPSQHIYRSRTRSSAMPYEVGLPSPSAMDIFHQLWEMMLEIRKHYEHIQSNNSSIGPRPLPSIRDGDVTTLMSHLQYEIDILSEHDARVADHYALDVRHLYDQYMNQSQQHQSRSARGSSTSIPHRRGQSQFGSSQSVHCSSSLSPPTYTLSTSAPRSRQITPSSSIGNEHMYSVTAPASAPAYGRNQEGFQQSNVYDHQVVKSQIGSWYDNRHISSAPPSPQDNVRQSAVAGSYYHHAVSGRTPPSMPRRVRKRRDEAEQSCLSCSAKETPEWRKGPTGPRTLCNACGLLFAKQCRKREMELQARGKRPKGARVIGPEEMTQEERENSLLELQMAVQARVNQTTSNVSGLPTMTTSSTSPSPGMASMNGNHTSHPNYFNSHPNHHPHHHQPPSQQQHQYPSQHNNHRLYGSPSLERSPPKGGGSGGSEHHITLPRVMSDQSHPPPPSLPPLLRH